ncbi:MAG: helix-turn-helix domain-containing protein [Alphaproteobacteria bacterium]
MTKHAPSSIPGLVERYVGMRLAVRRRALGISREDVDAGIREVAGTTEKLEAGAAFIGLEQLQALARTLDVQISYFFDGIADAPDTPPAFVPENSSASETLKLVQAYYEIPDGKTRKKVLSLLKSVGDETA